MRGKGGALRWLAMSGKGRGERDDRRKGDLHTTRECVKITPMQDCGCPQSLVSNADRAARWHKQPAVTCVGAGTGLHKTSVEQQRDIIDASRSECKACACTSTRWSPIGIAPLCERPHCGHIKLQ